MTLSHHARLRMAERGISIETVIDAIRFPHISHPAKGNGKRYTKGGISVVVCGTTIVTVHVDGARQ